MTIKYAETEIHKINKIKGLNKHISPVLTCDLRVTSALLYRLSYTGGELNLAQVRSVATASTFPDYRRQKKAPQFSLRGLFYNVEAVKRGVS